MHKKHSHGFTIVELMIVIIVIGILATLILMSYNNVRQQAENTKTTYAVKSYIDLLSTYKAMKESFPGYDSSNSATQYPCLSTDMPGGKCMSVDGTVVDGLGVAYEQSGFKQALNAISSNLPTTSSQQVLIGGHPFVGAYVDLTQNSDSHIFIAYVLGGKNAKCTDLGVIGNKYQIDSSSNGVLCGVDQVLH